MRDAGQFDWSTKKPDVPETDDPYFLEESKSFQNLDIAKSVLPKGSSSHSLNSPGKKTCTNNVCKSIFHLDTGSRRKDRKMLAAGRQSRWNDSRRLQLCEGPNVIVRNNITYNSDRYGTTDQFQGNELSDQAQSPKVDFKTLLTMFLKRSSIYALNQVGNSATTRRKVFWAVIMIIGMLGSGIQIIQYLTAYLRYPVVVNMDSRYSLDQEFPAVTVCNLNRVRSEFLPCLKQKLDRVTCRRMNYTAEDVEDVFANLTMDASCPVLFSSNVSISSLLRYMWTNLYVSQDEDSQIDYGHQGEDFIRSCAFNGEVCTLDNFTQTLDMEYGNCYTFNSANESTPALKTPFVGPNGGLELELDVETDKYSPQTRAVGARVQVHDPYHEEDVAMQGINISPGFETSVTLSKFMMIRLPKPYKDKCKEYPQGESKDICNEKCLHDMITKRCSCSVSGKKVRHCDLTKMSDICCVYEPPGEACQCPLSCEDTYYQFNIFSAVWPSEPYHRANPSNKTNTGERISYKDVRENRLKLKVYYDTLETVIYQQKPMYQNSEVFSQIGGQMGLWLGLSLVAIFECIENFVMLWKYRSKNLSQIRPMQ